MLDAFHRTFQRHVLHGVHDLRVLWVSLEPEDDEAREAGACEKLLALFLDFGGVHDEWDRKFTTNENLANEKIFYVRLNINSAYIATPLPRLSLFVIYDFVIQILEVLANFKGRSILLLVLRTFF